MQKEAWLAKRNMAKARRMRIKGPETDLEQHGKLTADRQKWMLLVDALCTTLGVI